jgi:carboxypeptidase family protein
MTRHTAAYAILVPLVLVPVPTHLRAQAVGEIVGTVTDPTSAVIPNAKVTAVEKATGLTRSTLTSGAGTYSLTTLPVGQYTVTAEASSFKSASSDVTLDVSQQREVNFTLPLASSTTAVEVSAAPPLLTTTNATLGGLVSGQQVTTLPLNGRDITNLILLQPGVNYEVDSSFPFLNYVAGNGNRGTTGSSYMDNIDTTDNELGGGQFSNFNLDAIAEFRVMQNNYSAEFGRGSGTIVTLVSKAGSNQFHGSAFEFLRNSAVDARNFFSTTVPPFRRNEFGGTLGGPIRKDKTFFFAQYAGFRQRLGEPNLIKVPTALERQGIVNIVGANGQPDQLMVPLNPLAKTVLNAYPLPNQPNGPLGPETYNFQYSLPENHNQWSARMDHRFSEKDSLFGRFTYSNNRLPATDPVAALENKSFSSHLLNDQRNAGLTYTHVFSPTLLNTLRIGWTLTDEFIGPGTTAVTYTTFADGSLAPYGADTTIFKLYPETFTFNDGINRVKGRHTVTFGAEFRRVIDDEFGASVGGPNGFYNFAPGTLLPAAIPSASGNNNIPAGGASPSGLVSMMEGAAAFYQRTLAFPGFGPPGGGFAPFGIRRYHLNGWFQDDFKWMRKLTVNLGLRYEYNSVPTEVAGRLAGIVDDPTFQGGKLYRTLVLNPHPIYFPDRRGFGPRVGFAYKVASKTVLRGGFGIFTNLPLTQTADQQAFGFPFASTAAISNPAYSLSPLPVFGLPVLTDLQGNPLPPGGDTKKIPPNTPVNMAPVAAYFGGPVLVNFTSMNLRNGYTMAGNFTLERELPGDMVLQVAYVTNDAAKLYASEWPNAYAGALPQYTLYTQTTRGLGEFQLTDNHTHSTYNSLQTMLRKVSASHGLQFQVSYTWSKALDNATTVFNGPATNSGILQNDPTCWSCEKSVAGFDFPHRLVANFVYALPFDKWQPLSRGPRRLVEGWQVTSIIQAQSGYPFTVNSPFGTVPFGTDVYVGFQATRPDLVRQPTLKSGGGPEEQFFSNAVIADGVSRGQRYFATPGAVAIVNGKPVVTGNPQDRPGSLGRNTFRTDPFSNFDVSLIKDTKLTETTTLQFRSEFFNFFNLHAFGSPGAELSASGFGFATGTVVAERQIQFALRLVF